MIRTSVLLALWLASDVGLCAAAVRCGDPHPTWSFLAFVLLMGQTLYVPAMVFVEILGGPDR